MRHKAIAFAARAHDGQYRKGTDIPYIIHPFEVASMLDREGADDTVYIAGLLHDTLEDTPVTEQDILENFGPDVLEVVQHESEDKSKSWEERKQHTIEELTHCRDQRILLVACADKANNLRSLRRDYAQVGDELWGRFKRGKESIKWYYHGLIDAFSEPEREQEAHLANRRNVTDYIMYRELCRDFQMLFVNYYINEAGDRLIRQYSDVEDETLSIFTRDDPDGKWQTVDEVDLEGCKKISCQEAMAYLADWQS